MEQLRALRAEIHARAWDRPQPGRVILELSWHLLVSAAGVALFIASDRLLVRLAGALVWTVGSLGVQSNTHNSSHYTTSRRRWVNELLTYFGATVINGVSATYWHNKHVVVHHPMPNILDVDGDADLMPFFAVYDRDFAKASRVAWLYYHLQWVLLPVALAALIFQMQINGWMFLAHKVRESAWKTSHSIDVGALVLHYVAWIGVPSLFFPMTHVVGLYVLLTGLSGIAIFIGAAPAHFPAEAVCVPAAERHADFILRQTVTTVNFRTGRLGRLLCSGIEFQIEHHLFPEICYTHYPKIRELVEPFCREHGYPYRVLGWGEGVWKALKVFWSPKRVEQRLGDFRSTVDAGRP